MSKFYVTNSSDIAVRIRKRIKDSGFELCANIESDGIYTISTCKLCVNNVNYSCQVNDFCVAIGTPILSGNTDPLRILDEFDGDVAKIRNKMTGQYACVISQNGIEKIFGDPIGAFNIYYFHKNGEFVVSNDLYDLAKAVADKISINELNLLEFSLTNAILNDETYFNEISRLNGDQYIEIDSEGTNFEIKVAQVKFDSYKAAEFEYVISHAVKTIKSKVTDIYHSLGAPSISITGGLDSRTVLAAFLSVEAKPALNFGVGNTELIFPEVQDLKLSRAIAKEFGLNLQVLNWTHPVPPDRDWDENIQKYGFHTYIYGGSKNIFDSFRKLDQIGLTMGYGGELYRNEEWLAELREPYFDIDWYLDHHYLLRGPKKVKENVLGLHGHLRKKHLVICEKYGLDPDHILASDFKYLDLEYRKVADTHMLNFLALFKYSFLPLFEQDIVEHIFIDEKYKRNSSFQLRLIHEMFPESYCVPIFSHHHLKNVDLKTMTLSDVEAVQKKNLKDVIAQYIPKAVLEKRRKMIDKASKTPNMMAFIKNMIANDRYDYIFKEYGTPHYPMKYLAINRVLDTLK